MGYKDLHSHSGHSLPSGQHKHCTQGVDCEARTVVILWTITSGYQDLTNIWIRKHLDRDLLQGSTGSVYLDQSLTGHRRSLCDYSGQWLVSDWVLTDPVCITVRPLHQLSVTTSSTTAPWSSAGQFTGQLTSNTPHLSPGHLVFIMLGRIFCWNHGK